MEQAVLSSFIPYDASTHFPLENLPYGVFVNPLTKESNCCTRVADTIVDLAALEAAGLFAGAAFTAAVAGKKPLFAQPTLNAFMSHGKELWHEVRVTLQQLFSKDTATLRDNDALKEKALFKAEGAQMRMPVFIRDYTDFYSSYQHAFNIGSMVRGPDNAIQPNWKHLPVGYHGRASSIVLSGTPLRRPSGQVSADKVNPSWSACKRLDFELEVGAFVGVGNELGEPVRVKEAADHLFGLVLLNDWSARDLQVWEYVPLGPFNAKNFGSSISPWIVTMEALAPFKIGLPEQEPKPLPYLDEGADHYSYNIELDVAIQTKGSSDPFTVATSNFKYLHWSVNQ